MKVKLRFQLQRLIYTIVPWTIVGCGAVVLVGCWTVVVVRCWTVVVVGCWTVVAVAAPGNFFRVFNVHYKT